MNERQRFDVFAPSLHLMGSALAIEKVSWFSAAFALTLFWLFGTADVGASLVAADNLLFGGSDTVCVIFRHFQVSFGYVPVQHQIERQRSLF